jgi:formylglycine-generating enzyme required for sulfatase activity
MKLVLQNENILYFDSRVLQMILPKSLLFGMIIGFSLLSGCGKNPQGPAVHREIVMKDIPAGTFTMGSDSFGDLGANPPHQVTLSAFRMSETDIAQEQYLAVMNANPSYYDSGAGALLRPVDQVSWNDAVKYCNALSLHSGLTEVYDTLTWTADFSKTGYRLPTEAQWEYACRAGSTTAYWWGPDTNGMGDRVWTYYNSGETTHPVATKLANAYGLYDMSGNVWQWCNDWYGDYGMGTVTDPTGPATGTHRVQRGGSLSGGENGILYDFRSAARHTDFYPYVMVPGNGFRVVLPR